MTHCFLSEDELHGLPQVQHTTDSLKPGKDWVRLGQSINVVIANYPNV